MNTERFRKKPVVVDAWKVADLNRDAALNWSGLPEVVRDAYEQGGWVFGALYTDDNGNQRRGISVPTLEGPLFANADDWIIRGVQGEFCPCKPDIFDAIYEPAENAGEERQ